jgi:hypothetical protein
MRIGDERIKKTSAQRVRREYELLALRDGEGVEDFALRLTSLVNQLATLGDPEPPHKVVRKYLRIARTRYKQLVVSIETLLDVDTLSVEEITGRLLASDDDPEPPPPNQSGGKLYLTEEQWLERYKQKEAENGRASRGSGGRGKPRGSKGKRAPQHVLGGGHQHCRLHPQQDNDKGDRRQDSLRTVERVHAGGASSANIRVRGARQERRAEHEEARRSQ